MYFINFQFAAWLGLKYIAVDKKRLFENEVQIQ